jgi:hypothetical protein
MKIRVSRGVGSNPKLWAVAADRQVGEFDLSDEPGRYDAEVNGISGKSGIIWKRGRIAEVYPRKLYDSVDEWVDDLRAEYPDATIVRADDEEQRWL